MTRPPLPDYKTPPIDEVIVGVHFRPIALFSEAHIGLLWQRLRVDFPTVESQPRLEVADEHFDQPLAPSAPVVRIGPLPTSNRTWFISVDDAYVVQIQNDLLLLNWRKRSANEYPHFEKIVDVFLDILNSLASLLAEELLTPLSIRMSEVSYVNWIPNDAGLTFMRLTDGARLSSIMPGQPEIQAWISQYRISDPSGTGVARLHIDSQPVGRQVEGDIVTGSQLSLTVRSALHSSATADEVRRSLLSSRTIIAGAFAELTTAEAQASWGRIHE